MEPKSHCSPKEFGLRSGLSVVTVRRYLRSGLLPSVQPGGRRHRVLIPCDALDRFRPPPPAATPADPPASAAPDPRSGPAPRWLQPR